MKFSKNVSRTVLIFLIILLCGPFVMSRSDNSQGEVSWNTENQKIELQQYGWYGENVWVNFDPSGNFHSSVSFDGEGLSLAYFDINDIPESQRQLLAWFTVWTWDSWDPYSENIELEVIADTNNHEVGIAVGDAVRGLIEQLTIIDFEFRGSSGFDEHYNGEWTELTRVNYKGHVDWSGFLDLIDLSIPRDLGGLASTIDISEANHASFRMWNQGDETFAGSIGLNWNTQLEDYQVTSHTISLKDLVPVSSFKKSPYGGLHINGWLPNVTSLVLNPGSGAYSDIEVGYNYHPSEESWNLHSSYDWWYNWDESASTFLSDITISFDYEFVPSELRSNEQVSYNVNPRGYVERRIDINGETASLIDPAIIPANVYETWMEVRTLAYDYESCLGLNIHFEGVGPFDADFNAVLAEYEALIGSPASNTWNHSINFWVDDNNYDGWGYYVDWYNLTTSEYNDIILNSYAFNSSNILQQTAFKDLTRINAEAYFKEQYGERSYHISYTFDPLDYHIETPVRTYPVSGIPTSNTIDIFNLPGFNWTGVLPWTEGTYQTRINIRAPVDSPEGFSYTPEQNNGWGFTSWMSDWNYRGSVPMVEYNLEYYTSEPKFTDESGTPTTLVDTFSLTFTSEIYSDSADLENPWVESYYWNTDYWEYFNHPTVSGTFDVRVEGNERWGHYQPYEGPSVARGIGSGIASMSAELYFSEVAADFPVFHRTFDLTVNATESDPPDFSVYNGVIDTSELADGDWTLDFMVTDNVGLVTNRMEQILVDNYIDGTTSAPTIDIIEGPTSTNIGAPDLIRGLTHLAFDITDFEGIFAVVVWTNLAGYIVEFNETSGFWEFDWDLRWEPEGYQQILLEVWDMDGHKVVLGPIYVEVDNHPVGNAPTVNFINPTDSSSLSGDILVQIEALDDWGIEEVTFQVDTRTPLICTLNEVSGYWEYLWDTTKVIDGTHTITTVVTDIDENTHTVPNSIEVSTDNGVTSLNGDPPVFKAVSAPTDGETVSDDVSFSLSVKDDLGIEQVQFAYDGKTEAMDSGSVDEGWQEFSFIWLTGDISDDTYQVTIKIIDVDTNQHTVIALDIYLTTDNGNENKPELGLPGFELMIVLPVAILFTLRRKRKK
ncbi:MAG: Ig-like domain-containing protein [Candidatus Kariarchaeaceae archaeon]